jgi:hypothetical protein
VKKCCILFEVRFVCLSASSPEIGSHKREKQSANVASAKLFWVAGFGSLLVFLNVQQQPVVSPVVVVVLASHVTARCQYVRGN